MALGTTEAVDQAEGAATPPSGHGRSWRASLFRFTGRIGRVEVVVYAVVWSLFVGMAAGVVAAAVLVPLGFLASPDAMNAAAGGLALLTFFVYVAGLAAFGVRRLHDMGRSGRWLLFGLVPVAGLLVALPLLLVPGQQGPNAYGERVKATSLPVSVDATGATSGPPGPELLEEAFAAGRRFAERQPSRT